MSKVDAVNRARRPASTGCVEVNATSCSVDGGVQNFDVAGILVIFQDRRESEGISVDTGPREQVGTRVRPTLGVSGVGDLVGKGGRDSEEEGGKDTHRSGQ